MSKFLQNLNDNMLAAVDVETTGSEVGRHDLVQIAVIPINGRLEPDTSILPFVLDVRPKRPEDPVNMRMMRINRVRYCDIVTRGMDAYDAAERFYEWYERLKLQSYKRIIPLAWNWPEGREFVRAWLGPKTFDLCFHTQYRDVMQTATFLNDRAGWRGELFQYPKCDLAYLCSQLKIERDRSHEAVDDARVTIEVYKRLVQEAL